MTVNFCVQYCKTLDQIYAGLENGDTCHCGNVLTVDSKEAPPADCSNGSNCSGDNNQKCGASNRLDLYRSDAPARPLPTIVPAVGLWVSKGCITDSNNKRTLPFPAEIDQDLTVGLCVNACNAVGYNTAGVEFAQDCWCGSAGLPSHGQNMGSNDCVLACPGDSSEICGGANALVVYQGGGP